MNNIKQMRTTKNFGYGLFTLLVLGVTTSTVLPFGALLFSPGVRHLNVIISIITLTASALLPALASYAWGDRATHTKNKALHSYNGVLLGISAYWLWQFFSVLGFNPLAGATYPTYLSSFIHAWPLVVTLLVMALIAASYARRNRPTLLHHAPYQFTLIGAVGAFFAYVTFHQDYAISLQPQSILFLLIPPAMTLISYAVITGLPLLARISAALIAMSIGSLTVTFSAIFTSNLDISFTSAFWLSEILGLAVWITYLRQITKKH